MVAAPTSAIKLAFIVLASLKMKVGCHRCLMKSLSTMKRHDDKTLLQRCAPRLELRLIHYENYLPHSSVHSAVKRRLDMTQTESRRFDQYDDADVRPAV